MAEIQTLEELYELAVKEIQGQMGTITIQIAGIPKISNSNDIIGNCVQEWIPQWLEDNGLNLYSNEHTQQFPDFTATIDGKVYDMEVKCWNYNCNPGFDIANFDSFYQTIFKNPKKLNAKYLIFGYTPTTHGFRIEKIYLKNIWEITKASRNYPIGLQVKRSRPYALRPYAFHKRPDDSFSTRKEFVEAIAKARERFPLDNSTPEDSKIWVEKVSMNFKELTGEDL